MSETTPLMNNIAQGPYIEMKTEIPPGFFEKSVRPCVAELVGVALFVFVGTMSVATGAGLLGVAIAHGLAIALLVTAMGNISGGHFNPAVTLGVLLAGAISPLNAVLYVISQLVGSILGAACTRGVLSQTAYTTINGGSTLLGPNTTVGEGVLCEVLLTSLLMLTILLSAVDSSSKSSLAPLAIGFAVVAGILAGGPVSGASLNPARSLGPAVASAVYNSGVWDDHWVYWVGPPLGSVLATILHRLFLAGPEKRILAASYSD